MGQLSRRSLLSMGAAGLMIPALVPNFAVGASRSPGNPHIDAALAALDEERLIALALELANTPSPLGQEEKTARLYCERMKDAGLMAHLQPFAPGRCNAIGFHRGSGGGRTLMFNGHLETGSTQLVDPYPIARLVDDEWLSGKGIWNMKGALAAFVAAVSAVREAGVNLSGSVLVAGTAGAWDESVVETRLKDILVQGYGIGVRHMLAHGSLADVAVVGEPTSFKLATRQFGTSMARIDVAADEMLLPPIFTDFTGDLTRAFALTPGDDSHSAIQYAGRIIAAIREWIPEYSRRKTVDGVPPLFAGISGIEGGKPGKPGVGSTCSLFLSMNTPPGAHPNALLDELEQLIEKIRKQHPGVRAHAELFAVNPGVALARDSLIASVVRDSHANIMGGPPEEVVVQWFSDSLPLNYAGVESLNYGPPGMIKRANEGTPEGVGEFIRVRDLVDYARVCIDLIVRVCRDQLH